ncbi:uncharacterized protein LOC142166431 [Nicotiana tabacum]|uniref:Uncharacterized protein LOC142166431 n=1 Tax=Nicotiana tabacum TaxID=4097 RepID=A0AC58SAC2_TOBAC
MAITIVVGGSTLNIISAYAPQVELNKEVKRHFWEDLDGLVCGIPHTEKLIIKGDLYGCIRTTSRGYDDMYKDEHLVTFQSTMAKIQIDYLLLRKCDTGLCTDCKIILSENLMTQRRLLVMDLEIMRKRKKKVMYDQPRIRWRALTKDKAQELREKGLVMEA